MSAPAPPPDRFHEAAVALVVSHRERSVLLIRRAERPGDPWSGHMALPGGRREPEDDTTVWTAIRETREEVGLDLAHAPLLFSLPPLPAHSQRRQTGVVVTAHAFLLESERPTQPNHEVAEIHWLPLSRLESGELDGRYDLRLSDQEGAPQVVKMPAFHYEGRVIWGLTHRILERFLLELSRTADLPLFSAEPRRKGRRAP